MSEQELAAFLRSHQVGDYVYTGTMFDEKLLELLLRAEDGQPDWEANFRAALRTIEGLRALEGLLARLDQWTPTMLEIARAVDAIGRDATGAIVEDSLYVSNCPLCHRRITGPDLSEFGGKRGHTADCAVTKARALLGKDQGATE